MSCNGGCCADVSEIGPKVLVKHPVWGYLAHLKPVACWTKLKDKARRFDNEQDARDYVNRIWLPIVVKQMKFETVHE